MYWAVRLLDYTDQALDSGLVIAMLRSSNSGSTGEEACRVLKDASELDWYKLKSIRI